MKVTFWAKHLIFVSLHVIFIHLLINLYIKIPSQIFAFIWTYFSFILFLYRYSGLYLNITELSKKIIISQVSFSSSLFQQFNNYKIQNILKNSAFFQDSIKIDKKKMLRIIFLSEKKRDFAY